MKYDKNFIVIFLILDFFPPHSVNLSEIKFESDKLSFQRSCNLNIKAYSGDTF